jgi:ParB family chromosome partitioning protein
MQTRGLGKGLGALIPDIDVAPTEAGRGSLQLKVELEKIAPNSLQPRRFFDDEKLAELTRSVRDRGMIQPLVVRRRGVAYELVAGERRLRAAERAGLKEVPVIVTEASDNEALELALIENLQREDLNPIEEAGAYRRLHEDFALSQEEIAARLGKSRPAVANTMRLLLLPREVQQEVANGRLPAGQARALLGLEREPLILAAAREVAAKGLSTRETERLVRRLKAGGRRRRAQALPADPDLRSLVERLQRFLGTKVRLLHQARANRGKIVVEYYSVADLERLAQLLGGNST